MNNSNNEKGPNKITKGIIIFAGILIAFGIIFPILLSDYFPSNMEWLSFWGSLVGSLIGAIATFIAFYLTYLDNQKRHEETQDKIQEQERIAILPFLNATENDSGYSRKVDANISSGQVNTNVSGFTIVLKSFGISNVGQSPAIDVKFFCLNRDEPIYLGNISTGENISLDFKGFLPANKESVFKLIFSDISGRKYNQTFTVFIKRNEATTLQTLGIRKFTHMPEPEVSLPAIGK